MAFQAYRRPLETVTAFKYLGRVLTASDDDWPSVVDKLRKDRSRWAYLSRILGREGSDPWTSRTFYKELFQFILLFGLETWEMTASIGRNLGGLHNRLACHMVGMKLKQDMEGQ